MGTEELQWKPTKNPEIEMAITGQDSEFVYYMFRKQNKNGTYRTWTSKIAKKKQQAQSAEQDSQQQLSSNLPKAELDQSVKDIVRNLRIQAININNLNSKQLESLPGLLELVADRLEDLGGV